VVIDNTLDRQFNVEVADSVWVTDITYIRIFDGFACLAVVHPNRVMLNRNTLLENHPTWSHWP